MAPHSKTAVLQFHIADGLWQETADNMRVIEPRSWLPFRKRKDKLYLLLEPVGSFEDSMAICRRVADVVQKTYASKGSITARLRAAVQAANELLFEENLNTPTSRRGVLGMTCAALRDADVYLAQVGPALAYVVRKGEIERFPADSPWLSAKAPTALDARQATALGWRKSVEPDLFHWQMEEGDLLVLCSTNLQRIATEAEIIEALAYQDSRSALSNLEHLAGDRELSAMILEAGPGDSVRAREPAATAPPPPKRARPAPSGQRVTRDARLELVGPAPEGEEEITEEERPEEEAKAPWETPAVVRKPLAAIDEAEELEREISPRAKRPERPSTAAQVLTAIWRGLVALWQRILPERGYAAFPQARKAKERGHPRRVPSQSKIALFLIALVIPIAILLLFFWNRLRLERAQEADLASMLLRARDLVESTKTGTTAEQRSALQDARPLVMAVLSTQPQNQDAQKLREEIDRQLDVVNKVSYIYFLGKLAEFPRTAEQAAPPSRVIVSAKDAYVLDIPLARVYRYTFDEIGEAFRSTVPEILTHPSLEQGGSARQNIVDIASVRMPLGPDDGKLLILADSGAILERGVQSPGLVMRSLENAASLRAPQAMETYYDPPNLYVYVLDPAANLIKKYQAISDGYTDAPPDYPVAGEKSDLRDAVDLAIDGSIYVLLKSGMIVKLVQGKAAAFSQDGLDQPLVDPVAISVSPQDNMEEGFVYVADAGNQRIVQFDKKGQFVRQFRPAPDKPPFDSLSDLCAVDIMRRILVLNGNTLYFMNIPE